MRKIKIVLSFIEFLPCVTERKGEKMGGRDNKRIREYMNRETSR